MLQKTTYNIPTEVLEIDIKLLAKIMGYPSGELPEPFDYLFLEYIEEAKTVLEGKAELKVLTPRLFNPDNYSVVIGDTTLLLDKIIFGMLKKAPTFAFFICTVGEKISKLAQESIDNNDPLKGFVMDTIGSLAAESAIEYIHKSIHEELTQNKLNNTNRYSPGYCNWNISEQKKLFSFFDDSKTAGVTLTKSCLMQPVKSVSGIIGIGEHVKHYEYPCKTCKQKDCMFSNAS